MSQQAAMSEALGKKFKAGGVRTTDIAKRLPPGQSLVADFPVLSAGPTPQISLGDWSFTLKVGPKPVATAPT